MGSTETAAAEVWHRERAADVRLPMVRLPRRQHSATRVPLQLPAVAPLWLM